MGYFMAKAMVLLIFHVGRVAATVMRRGLRNVSASAVSPTEGSANPLLDGAAPLPRLAAVDVARDARPAVAEALRKGRLDLERLEGELASKLRSNASLTYEEVITPLQRLGEETGRPWGLLRHLQSVKQDKLLRDVVSELEPDVVAFGQKVSQSKPIYEACLRLREDAAFQSWPEARRRAILAEVRDRRLSGVGLAGADAEEFNAITQRLSKLSNDFSNHVLDSTAAWHLQIHDASMLRGVPKRALELAAAKARTTGDFKNATGEKGPWLLGLEAPILGPILTYAEDSSLREKIFWAYATRASSGNTSNLPTISEILDKRQRSANLLGFKSYSEMSFASKMATASEVHALLGELKDSAHGAAEGDLTELKAFAKRTAQVDKVNPWDRSFYIQKLRKEKYDYDAEAMRPYLAMPSVLEGLFGLARRLFDAEVTEASADEAKPFLWDPSVRLFRMSRDGDFAGYVALDAYSRPGQKRAGAWVQPMRSRRSESGRTVDYPIATIVTNCPQPQGNKPSLLSFSEVETLFHEFGHALQHVLTRQGDPAVAGLNGVEWDAVEIASQFMEYWLTDDRATLFSFARHFKSGATLPDSLYKSLRSAARFRTGSTILGQVYLSSVDLRLHEQYEKGEDVLAIGRELESQILLEPPLEKACQLCGFSHIFAGGYAAGYYSYQWSKVLSADAFSAFEEGTGGLGNETAVHSTGKRFAETLLALGGGRAPGRIFEDFRGRQPSVQALLRYSGLHAPGEHDSALEATL